MQSQKESVSQNKKTKQKIEEVEEFMHLGSKITTDGVSRKDLQTRITKGRAEFAPSKMSWKSKSAFVNLREVLASKSVSLNMSKRLVRYYVLSNFLYGLESWILNKELEGRIEALQMWIYKRMLKISYKDSDKGRNVEQSRRETVVVEDGEVEEGGIFWTFN